MASGALSAGNANFLVIQTHFFHSLEQTATERFAPTQDQMEAGIPAISRRTDAFAGSLNPLERRGPVCSFPPFNLWRCGPELDVKGGNREVSVNSSRRHGGNHALHLAVKQLSGHLYRVEVDEPLENGEYALSPNGENRSFCFEIY